jgi:hypothetical protein
MSGTLPSGLSFSDQGDGAAEITGTPAASAAPAGESREYLVTLTADNGVGAPISQAFTITVVNDEEPVVIPPVIDDPLPPTLIAPPPAAITVVPRVKLSNSKVRLLVGQASRHVVKVLPRSPSPVECRGSLPRGARCRVTAERDVVIEGSSAIKRPGTYRLTVHVEGQAGTVRRTLVVQVRRP